MCTGMCTGMSIQVYDHEAVGAALTKMADPPPAVLFVHNGIMVRIMI